jgi:hypothetical protein
MGRVNGMSWIKWVSSPISELGCSNTPFHLLEFPSQMFSIGKGWSISILKTGTNKWRVEIDDDE